MNIEDPFIGFNVLLFKAFAETVSVLTDDPLFEGICFIFRGKKKRPVIRSLRRLHIKIFLCCRCIASVFQNEVDIAGSLVKGKQFRLRVVYKQCHGNRALLQPKTKQSICDSDVRNTELVFAR